MDTKRETDSNAYQGIFNTPLTTTDRSSKQKINKETAVINDTVDHMDLTYIFKAFLPKTVEYTFFSSAHGHFLRQTTCWDMKHVSTNSRKLKLYQASSLTVMLCNQKLITRKKIGKHTKTWRLNNILLNNEWVNNETKEEIKNALKCMKMRTQQPKICGTQEKQP